jgi:hypothetical protein
VATNDGLGRKWKEAIVSHFEVLSQHLHRDTVKIKETLNYGRPSLPHWNSKFSGFEEKIITTILRRSVVAQIN